MKMALKIIKWFFVTTIIAIASWLLVSALLYRVTFGGETLEFEAAVHYKFLELNFTNRQVFEEIFGKRIVRLDGYPPFYVSKDDHSKLWPEKPHEMLKKGYTVKAKIKSKSLTFGGLGSSMVVSAKVIHEKPVISK